MLLILNGLTENISLNQLNTKKQLIMITIIKYRCCLIFIIIIIIVIIPTQGLKTSLKKTYFHS